MNKELKAFRKICKNLNGYMFTVDYIENKILIETALKRLEALEIIKEKLLYIDFKTLIASTDYEIYCFMLNSTKYITKEEYDILKEVLI